VICSGLTPTALKLTGSLFSSAGAGRCRGYLGIELDDALEIAEQTEV
jgi:hypothetical protein